MAAQESPIDESPAGDSRQCGLAEAMKADNQEGGSLYRCQAGITSASVALVDCALRYSANIQFRFGPPRHAAAANTGLLP